MQRSHLVPVLLALALLVFVTTPMFAKDVAPSSFAGSAVSIPRAVGDAGDAFEIAGWLRMPTVAKPEAGFPAVLFISGSASQTHDGRQGPLNIGTAEILDAVSAAGFVVLATDDRGIGKTPTGEAGFDTKTLGYQHLIGDARTALTWLRAHDAIRKDRIFVIGHSEGGLTAPLLANEGGVAGLVFMAALGRNIWHTTLDQVRNAAAHMPPETAEHTIKLQIELMTAVKEKREPNFEDLPDTMRALAKQTWTNQVEPIHHWWGDHFRIDVPATHAAVKCPCFVTQGASDMQVTVDKDAKSIARNLLAGGCTDITLKVYDDLDHLFKACGGKKSTIQMYMQPRPVSKAFIADVVAWLTSRAK